MILYLIKSGFCLIVLLAVYLIFLEQEKMHRFNRFFLLFALMLGLTIPFISFQLYPDPSSSNVEKQYAAKLVRNSAKMVAAVTNVSTDFVEEVLETKPLETELKEVEGFQQEKGKSTLESKEVSETTIQGQNHELVEPVEDQLVTSTESKTIEQAFSGSEELRSDSKAFVSIKDIIIGLYALVSLILFIRLFYGLVNFYRKRKSNPVVGYGSANIFLLTEPTVPHTFLNTIYVNKEQFESGKLSKQILDHELTHAKQKHSVDVLFIEVLRIIFWFNPIFYIYKRAIQINHEFLADDSVIRKTLDPVSYQQLLINSVFPSYQTGLASSFNYSLTKKRFKMMVKEHSKLATVSKKVLLLPILACIVFVFCTKPSTENREYLIDGEKYIAYHWEGLWSNQLILTKAEDVGQTLNVGKRNYYDKSGNLFSGEWVLYNNDENEVDTRSEIENGKLLTRVQYTDQVNFSVMKTSYRGDTVLTAMFSAEDELFGHNTIKMNADISTVLIQSRDSNYLWGEMYVIEDKKESLENKPVILSTTYDEAGSTIIKQEVLIGEETIPATQEHIEIVAKNAKERYEASLSEYLRLLAKKDIEQVKYAYLEMENEHLRWIAFKKIIDNDLLPPAPPIPTFSSDKLLGTGLGNTTQIKLEYEQISKEFDEKEAIYLETKKDSDLIEYLNVYEQRVNVYKKLKEIDGSVLPPRPAVPVKKEQYDRVKNKIGKFTLTSKLNELVIEGSPFLGDYLSRLSKYEGVSKGYISGNKSGRDVLYERIRVMYYHERLTPKEQKEYKVPQLSEDLLKEIELNKEERLYEDKLSEFLKLKNSFNELPKNSNHILYANYRDLRDLYNQIPFYSRIFIVQNFPKNFANSYMIKDEKILSGEKYSKLFEVSLSNQDSSLALHYIDEKGNAVSTTVGELSEKEIQYLQNNTKKSNVTQVYPLPDERKPSEEEIQKWQDEYYFQIWVDGEIIENIQLLKMDMDDVHHFRIHEARWNGNRRVPYDFQILIYSQDAYKEMIEKYRPNKSIIAFHDATIVR